MTKSRLQSLLAWILLAIGIAWSIYDWLFVDEGLRYFSKDPFRILVSVAIVAVGTPLLFGYEALPAKWKLRAALWIVGALATGATAVAVHCLYSLARLAKSLLQTGDSWLYVLAGIFPCVIASCLWLAFARIRRIRGSGHSRSGTACRRCGGEGWYEPRKGRG